MMRETGLSEPQTIIDNQHRAEFSETTKDVVKELSGEDQEKLVDFTRIITDVMLNQKIRPTKFPFSEEHTEDGIKSKDIPIEISNLIGNNYQTFTKEVLAELASVEQDQLTDEQYQSILASLVASSEVEDFLAKIGRTKLVVVLPGYRGYRSCALTEKRLLNELRKKEVMLVRINFTDGTSSLLAIKFTDVILATCVESNNPTFNKQNSYRPLGKTVGLIKDLDMQDQKSRYHKINVDNNDKLSQVWSYNRPLIEENFHVPGKRIEDQQIVVNSENNWQAIEDLSKSLENELK